MTDKKEQNSITEYDFFHSDEALLFAFIRIPRLLITEERFKHIGNDSKLLYGLLLDRTFLSQKNGWIDQKRRVFILYKIDDIAEDLNVSKPKAIRLLQELEEAGLASKKRQGQGKPTKVYVHKFFNSCVPEENTQPIVIGSLTDIDGAKDVSSYINSGEEIATPLLYDYFYDNENLQFQFYMVPKALLSDEFRKKISNDSKILFGLLLNRVSLSIKNNWVDEFDRVFVVYTIESVMQDMNVASAKAVRLLKELEESGLISKKKTGQGKPAYIYVRNFQKTKTKNKTLQIEDSRSNNIEIQEVTNPQFQNFSSSTFKDNKDETQNITYSTRNNTNLNYTEEQYLSYPSLGTSEQKKEIDEIDRYIELIYQNMEFVPGERLYDEQERQELFEELINLICDVVCIKTSFIRINGKDYPYSIVKSTFLKLRREHVEYVMESMKKNNNQIRNMRNYLISSLYNSVNTIAHRAQNDYNAT